MKVVLYARVSKDELSNSNRFQDPENQLIALRKYCKAKDYLIIREYIDKTSGAKADRPQFREMMSHSPLKVFDAVLIWKLDRFSREPMFVVLGYINKLSSFGVGLISMTESWLDTRKENPVSELILSIMAWFSAEERRKISERTKLGIARKKENGSYKGGKRGKDKKPRKRRGDIGIKRGSSKTKGVLIKDALKWK